MPHDFINQFFRGSGGLGNMFEGSFVESSSHPHGRHRAPRRQQNHPFGLFGFFDFPSIFNDNQFDSFGGRFQNMFDPSVFMNNFHSNFRSSRAFEDFLNRTAQMYEPHTNPASKEVVEKLPIIKVEEKHCKKNEDEDKLEPPS